jgi:hydrogenase-4 component F
VNGTHPPRAVAAACLLLFLATMTLVALSQNLGLLWVAVEATTLASAPLIFFHRHHRSLEATWKYLLICSVGIALALLGNFCLALAASFGPAGSGSLVLEELVAGAAALHPEWLRAAFVLLLVGYGTKMGLAPLHTWLPDAHAEAPSVVSSLLSGALLTCAFLGIVRAYQVLAAAGMGSFAAELLIVMGLLSMAVAAAFMVAQGDYKRLLAYSSVEHMGILAVGVGLGGGAAAGAFLHAVNHAFAKGMLFLLAGNILLAYRSKSTHTVRGVGVALPVTGVLWVVGLLAITGSPPFGTFLSELMIVKGAIDDHRPVVAGLFLALLAVAFLGMARPMLAMVQGTPLAEQPAGARDHWLALAPPAVLAAAVLVLGLWVPPWLDDAVRLAARLVAAP